MMMMMPAFSNEADSVKHPEKAHIPLEFWWTSHKNLLGSRRWGSSFEVASGMFSCMPNRLDAVIGPWRGQNDGR